MVEMTIRVKLSMAVLLFWLPVIGLAQTVPDEPTTGVDVPTLGQPDAETPETDLNLPASDDGAPQRVLESETITSTEQGSETPGLDISAGEQPVIEEGVSGFQDGSDTQTLIDEGLGASQSGDVLVGDVDVAPDAAQDGLEAAEAAMSVTDRAMEFLRNGGPALWAIAALSVVTLALIFWKIWRLALAGAWVRGHAVRAVEAFEANGSRAALALVDGRRGIRSQVMVTTLRCLDTMSVDVAREETARVAKRQLGEARVGLGALELISTVAPLLGLLGTVLGMIAAFQALQAAGARADPTLLAGGIWEALLTTAAGMAVAIPASAALTWFESVIERMRQDIEDNATRLFVSTQGDTLALAAQ